MFPSLSEKEFNVFQKLIYNECGINLSLTKKSLVQSRLQKRLRELGIDSYTNYHQVVVDDKSRNELIHLIDSISTNKTEFFREIKHFDLLRERILPDLVAKKKREGSNKIRIWCAASSSGEEAYTIAMLLYNQFESQGVSDAKILATDISTKVLSLAIKGAYNKEQIKNVPDNYCNKFFSEEKGTSFIVKDVLKNMITFRRFNLLDLNQLGGNKFDIIFCRNVMIYFDYETRYKMIKKFYNMLLANGYFFLSHSEKLSGNDHGFKFIQPAVYMK